LLIALAIDIAKNSESGIKSLAMQALAAGATKKEITETLRIANYICGVGSMYTAGAALKDVL
jgi:alkylhydroperoxidase/carboxymuconolactone decarboxylase family protein YurZ